MHIDFPRENSTPEPSTVAKPNNSHGLHKDHARRKQDHARRKQERWWLMNVLSVRVKTFALCSSLILELYINPN